MQPYQDSQLIPLVKRLADSLMRHHYKLVTNESCTGGWLAKCCTEISGSSQWFNGGLICYDNMLKQRWSGVPKTTLSQHGAVSSTTAIAMAHGVLNNSGADVAIATTGIAGPTGATNDKPVGTVFIAVAINQGKTVTKSHLFQGDRIAVRYQTVEQALQLAMKTLEQQ